MSIQSSFCVYVIDDFLNNRPSSYVPRLFDHCRLPLYCLGVLLPLGVEPVVGDDLGIGVPVVAGVASGEIVAIGLGLVVGVELVPAPVPAPAPVPRSLSLQAPTRSETEKTPIERMVINVFFIQTPF